MANYKKPVKIVGFADTNRDTQLQSMLDDIDYLKRSLKRLDNALKPVKNAPSPTSLSFGDRLLRFSRNAKQFLFGKKK